MKCYDDKLKNTSIIKDCFIVPTSEGILILGNHKETEIYGNEILGDADLVNNGVLIYYP